jgi:hypothetical protein
MKAGSVVNSSPADGSAYTASASFGNGSQIGSGNYVVYNGTGNSVNITNLDGNTTYHVSIFEFRGPTGMQDYLTVNPATGSQLTLPNSYLETTSQRHRRGERLQMGNERLS